MKISYAKLQTYFAEPLPTPDALGEAFTFHAFEIEGMERDGADTIMDIKVLPDRACYAKSYEGIAREAKAILSLKPKEGALPPISYTRTIAVAPAQINAVLGTNISGDEIIAILKRLDIIGASARDAAAAKSGKPDSGEFVFSIPSDRLDLQDWRDIPEEIGRIYGYDKIAATLPKDDGFKAAIEKTFYYAEKIKNILANLGFSEIYAYSLVAQGAYEIEKPLAADKNHLRTNLSEGIAKSLELNARNADLLGLEAIKIFEVGKAFPKEGESLRLAFGAVQVKKAKGVNGKSIVDAACAALAGAFGANTELLAAKQSTVGTSTIIEIDLDVLIKTLPAPASYADLGFGKAVQVSYKKFSAFPFIVRDIALFVPETISSDEVWGVIAAGIQAAGASDLLARHGLFDAFKKDGKVSYGFRMVFQSMDRTLTDTEAASIMEAVYQAVKSKGWEVR